MPEINPPSYSEDGCVTAQQDRLTWGSIICQEGLEPGTLLPTHDGGNNFNITVTPGQAWIQGDDVADQGMYHVVSDSDVVVTLDPADPTDDRIDLVVARVYDTQYVTSPSGDPEWVIEVITGAPSPAPVAPPLPPSAIILRPITVPAGSQGSNIGLGGGRETYQVCENILPGVVAGGRTGGATTELESGVTTLLNAGNNADHQMGGVTSVGGNGGLIVPLAGWYSISAGFRVDATGATSGEIAIILRANGNEISRNTAPPSGVTEVVHSVLYYLEEGDNVQIFANQNTGSTLSTSSLFGFPYLRVARFQ